jgi:hypothetical protein
VQLVLERRLQNDYQRGVISWPIGVNLPEEPKLKEVNFKPWGEFLEAQGFSAETPMPDCQWLQKVLQKQEMQVWTDTVA